MLLKTSQSGVKNAFEYLAKLPFTKALLHKVSEAARGKCIAFFSLHRVLENNQELKTHPHFLNRSALTTKQVRAFLTQIKKTHYC